MIAKGKLGLRPSQGRSDRALLNKLSSKSQGKINLPVKSLAEFGRILSRPG
jgi:hypothetical protein